MATRTFSLLLLLAAVIAGCGGAQSASRQRTRYAVQHGVIPQPSEIRVEEYLADYPEDLPNPAPHAAGLSLEAARAAWASEDAEPLLVVQAAVRGRDADVRPPMALMFVVDRSGSMAEADKMTYVRRGLHQLVDQLDPRDAVGVVAFDSQAELLLPLTQIGEASHMHRAIDQLLPRGGTNLSHGLELGYSALGQWGLEGYLRRVVLLTDAMANVGETDMHRIASWAERGDEAGIRLSAIGVGLAYDDAVLAEMARRGHGNHYFLDSPQEIDRVFRHEVTGLLEDVADRVQLAFTPANGVEVVRVEGAPATSDGGAYKVDLGRLGATEHRVVLFTLRGVHPHDATPEVGAFELDFTDMRSHETMRQRDARPVFVVRDAAEGSVARNSAVAWMARDLRVVSELAQAGRYADAQLRLDRVRAVIGAIRAARPTDAELDRDLAMLGHFAEALSRSTGQPVRELRARIHVQIEEG